MEMEKVFYSRPAIRILFHLIENGMETETRLMHVSRSNHKNFNRHINRLSSMGLVEKKRLGRIVVIRLREDSEALDKIINTYKIWKESDK